MDSVIPEYFLWEILAGVCVMVISFFLLSVWRHFTRKEEAFNKELEAPVSKTSQKHTDSVLHDAVNVMLARSMLHIDLEKKKEKTPFISHLLYIALVLIFTFIIGRLIKIPLALWFIIAFLGSIYSILQFLRDK